MENIWEALLTEHTQTANQAPSAAGCTLQITCLSTSRTSLVPCTTFLLLSCTDPLLRSLTCHFWEYFRMCFFHPPAGGSVDMHPNVLTLIPPSLCTLISHKPGVQTVSEQALRSPAQPGCVMEAVHWLWNTWLKICPAFWEERLLDRAAWVSPLSTLGKGAQL